MAWFAPPRLIRCCANLQFLPRLGLQSQIKNIFADYSQLAEEDVGKYDSQTICPSPFRQAIQTQVCHNLDITQHVFHEIFLGGYRVIMGLYGEVTMAAFYNEDLSKKKT